MTEEKKAQIRKKITIAEFALMAVMIGYLVYGLATKNSNPTVFSIIAIAVVIGYLILSDVVEPYLTEVFKDMNDFRKDAYKKYVLWDVVSMAGLVYFVLNFTDDGNMLIYAGLLAYLMGSKKKRTYQGAYKGDVTQEDVEAAKAAADAEVIDVEAVEIEDIQEPIEE